MTSIYKPREAQVRLTNRLIWLQHSLLNRVQQSTILKSTVINIVTIYYKGHIGLIMFAWNGFVKRYERVLTTHADVRSIEVLIGINSTINRLKVWELDEEITQELVVFINIAYVTMSQMD